MSQARALLRVQEFELAINERTKRIKEINALLADDQVIQDAQNTFDQAQSELQSALKAFKDMELQIESVVNKQKATESRLYGGNVKNPKELQDMQNEVAALSRRHSELDDQLLELMVARDDAQDASNQADDMLKSVTSAWETEHQDLLDEKQTLLSEAEKILQDRKQAVKNVQPDAMKIYNSLRSPKANRPVAELVGKSCSICGIEQNNAIITSINQDNALVYCQSCGRILVR
jgi:predicted  nucleic acid-binding Zn-ribbon protein